MLIEKIKLENSWKNKLLPEFEKDYMKELKKFLAQEISKGKIIFPHGSEIFTALNTTSFENVKVVIIGQDPYHGVGEAHGLCFSVKPSIKVPPSLKNIYKEIESDLKIKMPNFGYLKSWAEQGVLMLNSVLTVEKDNPASHRGKGWEQFTDRIIELLNEEKKNLVFILWGKDAKNKCAKIDRSKHLVLESGYPSPFSAHLFLGNKHFSKANNYLASKKIQPIDWSVNPESR